MILRQTDAVKNYTETTNALNSKLDVANALINQTNKQKRDFENQANDYKKELETIKKEETQRRLQQEEELNTQMTLKMAQFAETEKEMKQKLERVNSQIDQFNKMDSIKTTYETKISSLEKELLLVTQAFYKMTKKSARSTPESSSENNGKENMEKKQQADEMARRIRERNQLVKQAEQTLHVNGPTKAQLEAMAPQERRQHTLANRPSLREQALANRSGAPSTQQGSHK